MNCACEQDESGNVVSPCGAHMDLIRKEQERAAKSPRQSERWPLVICRPCTRLVQQAIQMSVFGDESEYIFEFCGRECSRAAFQILRTALFERVKAHTDLINTTITPHFITKTEA